MVQPMILTKDGIAREAAGEILTLLEPLGENEITMVAYTLIALIFDKREDDREWLRKRWENVSNRLKNNWFLQEITEEAVEKAREEGKLEVLRQTVVGLVEARFNNRKLSQIAKGAAALIDNPQQLQDLILKIGIAGSAEEAKDYLLSYPESA